MSHTDDVLDNSLNTWINAHQAALAAQPAGFVPLATNDQDVGDIAVVEDDGTLLIPAGASNSLDHIAIVEKFYQTHDDIYDFLLIFSAVVVTNGSVFKLVHNVTTGTTVDLEDNRDVLAAHPVAGAVFDTPTGEIRNLKGITQYVDLSSLPLDPNVLIPFNNDTPLSLIAQEIGHYWGMAAPHAVAAGGAQQGNLQGRGNSHWSFFANTQASSMEGNSWLDNGGVPNNFTAIANTNGYFPFDLYLMGLLDPAVTPSTFYVSAPSADTNTGTVYSAASTPLNGASINGTRVNVPITQVINALEARSPDVTTSQKDFKAAFILVVANGATDPANAVALQASVDQVDAYRSAWEPYWSTSTLAASTMDTALTTGRPVDIYVRDNLGDDGSIPTSGPLYHSPDIILRQTAVPDPAAALGDPASDPGSDPVEVGNDNYVYVRVHNRGDYPADANVKVFFADLTGAIDPSSWMLIGETKVDTVTPDGMLVSDAVLWSNAPDPGVGGHFCLIAMLDDPLDPEPDASVVVDVSSYLDFVRGNNNVAYRNLTFVNLLPDSDADFDFYVGSLKESHRADIVFDARDLPRSAQVVVALPAVLRRDRRLRLRGFERGRRLILNGGGQGVIGGVQARPGRRSRIRFKMLVSERIEAGEYALEVRHRVGRAGLGGVGYRFGVIPRHKARYLGDRETGLFYPASDARVARLGNRRLRPFRSIDDAVKAGYSAGRGLYVQLLGPAVVRGELRRQVVDRTNRARDARSLQSQVARRLGGQPRHFNRELSRRLLQARPPRRFENLEQIHRAMGGNAPALAELVDALGETR